MNERVTENLVRDMLRKNGYYNDESIIIDEQKSSSPKIDKLLQRASKRGTGRGYPEFIISFSNKPNEVIVIECKANVACHESPNKNKYKDYAVDGVLLYASYLKDDFTVTAIAVSGMNEKEKKISTFLWLKGNISPIEIQDKIFLSPEQISNIILEQKNPITEAELISTAIRYNEQLHRYSIPEIERCTLISAILIALQSDAFRGAYKYYEYTSNEDLLKRIFEYCEEVLRKKKLDANKIKVIIDEYRKIQNNKCFIDEKVSVKNKGEVNNTILRDLISNIEDEILPYVKRNQFDVLGKFYTQFIRYAGGDKKTGLVLTPAHITEFFCDIAQLTENDIVYDPCCGTGGFLVSSMNYMLSKAGHNTDKQNEIKSKQLLGVELRSDMFSHACSNMMMRGDGKSYIFHGDCRNFTKEIQKLQPTVSFLNPPYQDGNAAEQLEFIEHALDCVRSDGRVVAICQMSTVVSEKKDVVLVKERLLSKHSLNAVFSMPNDLFHPVGVITCILVFTAGKPHSKNKETFFGYFKDDGFVKMKNKGRQDKGQWQKIKEKWLNAFENHKNIPGLCVTKCVSYEDEWCAEAYMETDYSLLNEQDFIKTIKEYVAFRFKNDAD
ncbi:class I SAM-dependent DNA methyltransferase [Bartonella sp. DGB1]|uniref:HsdM family class I SAM-dependent methyltransferase n=1 Tax=Bartonella sp. DGB1 TaxID=3239807 RepID=UPI0035262505